jgi:dolichyl-phosphate-mannose-protein mannosyltransferase
MLTTERSTTLRELELELSAAAAPLREAPPPASWTRFLPSPHAALIIVLLASVLCRVVWLSKPDSALIFDEAYYVNAARVMLGHEVLQGAPYADQAPGRDPNREHPPLGKALIAGSIAWLGDNPLGWRLPSVIAGSASILLVYAIVRAAKRDAWLGVLAAALFAFDNLAFVHSRIGSLDMMLVAFMLLGAWLALRRQPLLAGVAFALAALVKLNGSYAVGAAILVESVLAFWAFRSGTGRPLSHLRAGGMLLLGSIPVWFAGLWLLDIPFGLFQTPWEHLHYILQFGLTLTRDGAALNQESYPWQWLVNEVPMTYLRTDQQIVVNDQVIASYATVFFRGAMNPFIIGAAPLAAAYAAWRAVRCRDLLALWLVAWIVATYLPFFPLAILQHRIMYIFYFLPTLPAVAIAIGLFVRNAGLPRFVQFSYMGAVALGFISYFPFRSIPS